MYKFLLIFPAVCFFTSFNTYSEGIVINEFLASNSEIFFDEDDDDSDWIELYNSSNDEINLNGWRISNKNDFSNAWHFPNRKIAPKKHLVIFASGKNRISSDKYYIEAYGTGINAFNDEDSFRFHYQEIEGDFEISVRINSIRNYYDNSTVGLIMRDELTDDSKYAGIFSIIEKNLGFWLQQRTEEDNKPNRYWVYWRMNDYPNVWMKLARRGDSIYTYTWMEDYFWAPTQNVMFHPADRKVYVGLAFSSSEIDKSTIFAISELKVAEKTVDLQDFSVIEFETIKEGKTYKSDELHTNFVLNKDGGSIYLWNEVGQLIDYVNYPEQYSDISFGRCSESANAWKYLSPPTPLLANGKCYERRCAEPIMNKKGWFIDSVIVNLISTEPGSKIYYTTDGCTPTDSSNQFNGNGIVVKRTTTFRAVTCKDGFLPSKVMSYTIFINENSTLPVISIISDSINFWDKNIGLFVEKNYWNKLEIPAHFEYYNKNKELVYHSNAGVRLFGKSSKYFDQKSISFFARNKYDSDNFNYKFFSDSDIEKPSRLTLRNSGTDWPFTMMRDGFLSVLIKELNHLNIRSYQPISAFINGKYWGILNLRDKIDEKFLSNKYGISADSINVMEDPGNWGRLQNGSAKSYHKFFDTLMKLDMSLDESYNLIDKMMDFDNFIDYSIAEIHFVNLDWPGNNVKFWQSSLYDGKWRWILNDLDFSYGMLGAKPDVYMYNIAFETQCDYSKIAQKLLENDKFKYKFINRTADLLNTLFVPERVLPILDSLVQQIAPEIPRHQMRWDSSAKNWQSNIQNMRDFADKRQYEHRRFTRWYFKLKDNFKVSLQINDSSAGKIQISTLTIDRFPWNGIYFSDVPIPVKAIPNEGYKFFRWSGNKFRDSSSSMLLYLTEDLQLEAQFIKEGVYTESLVINEIMYKPDINNNCKNWFELYNNSSLKKDISKWYFSNKNANHIFTFKQETIISGDGYLVVCEDTASFKSIYPDVNNVIGNFDFGLDRSDEIKLFNAQGELSDLVNYSAELPWPQGADGSGKSIELINPEKDNNIYWNWVVSENQGGTPGKLNTFLVNLVLEESKDVVCYPNPASDYFYLQIKKPENSQLKIILFNHLGNEIPISYSLLSANNINEIYYLNCEKLAAGVYYCKIEYDNYINDSLLFPIIITN